MSETAEKITVQSTENNKPIEAGVFLIDKPEGPTSFKIVQLVRRALKIKKVGHSGTLDPFASGLLIVCAGRPATKIIPLLMDGDKEYEATLHLGVETDTHDPEGEVVSTKPVPVISMEEITCCLAGFKGEQLQIPPRYSALKHNGKPLYYYARKGIEVKKEARRIEIKDIECLSVQGHTLSLKVLCSKGTYIRTLAADIGKTLGCGAHLSALRRTKNGPFSVNDAVDGEQLVNSGHSRQILQQHLLTVERVLTAVNN